MKKIFTFLAIASLTLSSCATIFTGTKDEISFKTNPSGAKVIIDGLEVCTTPCTTKVSRSLSKKSAEFKLDGYDTKIITLDKKFNAVSIINLLSIIGWGVDAATGSIMKYDRKGYDIELDSKKMSKLDFERIEIDTKNKTASVYVATK